ncbi:hypothetical protein GF380_00620 [Candidatus Uhrbacteria bacterium]|nr:hypothetical protein [Candidatus Uhrbacteria bacterium]MBD3283878.1 hypothetical protein [Candidatus Uhrbacteria bacterium]
MSQKQRDACPSCTTKLVHRGCANQNGPMTVPCSNCGTELDADQQCPEQTRDSNRTTIRPPSSERELRQSFAAMRSESRLHQHPPVDARQDPVHLYLNALQRGRFLHPMVTEESKYYHSEDEARELPNGLGSKPRSHSDAYPCEDDVDVPVQSKTGERT